MAIIVKDLVKEFNTKVLENFSFSFPEKGVVCLLGRSGCGKTTLINCIAGLEKADGGSIEGKDDSKISFVFQEDRLIPWISAKRNLLVVNEDESICDDILDKMGLSEHKTKLPDELSGDMRQRVAIARAVAYGGDIIFLDEPFKGIDVKTKAAVIDSVKGLIEDKLCIFITHDLEEAMLLSDIIVILDGPPLKIKSVVEKEKTDMEYLLSVMNETN